MITKEDIGRYFVPKGYLNLYLSDKHLSYKYLVKINSFVENATKPVKAQIFDKEISLYANGKISLDDEHNHNFGAWYISPKDRIEGLEKEIEELRGDIEILQDHLALTYED